MPKKDYQKEMAKLMDQLKVNFQKFSKDAGVFAKKGEKKFVKASKIGRLQLDIMSLNIQREKLYYEIGKKIASLRTKKGNVDNVDNVVDSYLKKLRKIEADGRSKKREISRIKKENPEK